MCLFRPLFWAFTTFLSLETYVFQFREVYLNYFFDTPCLPYTSFFCYPLFRYWISWTDHLIFFFYISSFCILCSISWDVSSALSSVPFFELFIWYIFNAGEPFYFYLFFLRVCMYSCFVDEISSSLRIDGYVNNIWWFNRYV